MSNSTIMESAISYLCKDKMSKYMSASKDQWIKSLEEEELKKRNSMEEEQRLENREENVNNSKNKKTNEKGNVNEVYGAVEKAEIKNEINSINSKEIKKTNASTVLDGAVSVRGSSKNGMMEQINPIPIERQTEPATKVKNCSSELVKSYLEKEQKYYELQQPFKITVKGNGVEIWFRDSSINIEQYQRIITRLKEGLRHIGIELVRLTINGELIWDQQNTPEMEYESGRTDGINKIY